MRFLFSILFFLITTIAYSQNKVDVTKEFKKLPASTFPGCDTNGFLKQYYSVGDLQFEIQIDSAFKINSTYTIYGSTLEKMCQEPIESCQIWLMEIDESKCSKKELLGKSDENGKFEIAFEYNKNNFLCFDFISYTPFKINISELKN